MLISEFTTMSNPGGDIGYPPDYLTVYIGTIPQGDYARPWVPVIYTNSTVAYCEVMINDEPAAIGDEVGAFVNYECRGVGSVVTDGMNSYATMNIQGESPELVNFAVYVAYMDVVLISDFTTMSNPGGDIGYPPNYLPVYIGTIPQGDYARPWVPVIYTNSTVAYCEVKINDEPAAEDDEVGAFVNFECRGVGYVITDGMNSYATMNIQGESPELVNFAVYDASMDEVLISEFTTMSNPGGDIGYPPNYLPVYIGTIPQGDYARPWVPVIYTNSTVAYCEVMINDESAAIEDEVGAFVNFECRGVGYVITDGMNSYATMNIQGESPELVNFAVYDASMDEVLLSEFTTMSNPGGDIGYPPNYLPVYIGTIPQGDYARPWVPVIYTNSTVAYCEVKIYGEQAAEDDEVGAFVNFECRGTGNVIIERAGSYATLNIQGEMAELVNFAVWDASENEVLISEYTTLSNPGGDIGYPPNFLPVYIGEEIPVDFPRPWDIVIYPNSTIAYCIVTVDGVPAALEDEVGAFAGLECRGIGNIVSNLTASYSTMNIQGDEPELIYFAVWDASSDEVMISEFTAYSSPGGDIGYPPDFLPITVGEALPSEFPRPWVISIYPNSTVAYCQIKINGLPATTNDELGSFVGTECRGIGNIVVSDTGSYSTMNIQGDVPEFVQFAVWDSSSDLVYVSDYTTFTNPGYDIGYPPDFLPIFVGEEVPTDFPRPWNIVIYPNSTVAYCDVTVFGRPASLEDEVGAFVGTECRGIGYISHGNNMASSSINIQGEMPEPVSFAVWISSLDMVLLSEYTTTTNPGGDIGYPPNLLPITVGEELPSIFPRPWEIVIYPNSTVAYCQVKLNDGNCTLEDEVAAFVGEECRGTGEIVFLDGETFTTMNIQGEEPEIVQFALWDSDLEEMYLSDHLAMTAPGSDIGYPPNFLPIYFSTENAVIYPPQINLPESITMQEDGSRILNLANYITGYNYTLSMDAIAELGASLVGRTLIINPADNWNGETTLTIYAQENNATSYDNMQIIVNSVNDAPIIIEPFVNLTLEEDFAGFTIDLDEHFYDVENDQITYSIGFDQSEIYAVLNGSILSINSRLNWFGSTTISISANDNVTRAITQASFLILVTPVNDPPVINLPESYTFAEDGSRTVNLAAYVSDVDGNPLTISMNAGVNITAVINGLNITFHATPDWFGTEIVTINVSDNQSRAIASDEVPVIVTPVNDAPRLLLPIADIQVVEDFIPINIDLYSHFTDVDDPVLDFSYTCNNPNVNITLENGIFTLSSAYNWSGSANISITAADDQYSVTDNFIYQVTAANDGPVITDYQPLDSSLEALAGDIIDFSVTAYDPDSVINYSWLKNGESIASGYNEVSVTFSTVGDYVITAVVTDQEFQITQSWQVTVYLNSDWIPVVYTNSTIAYGRVMINDNNASESDLVGAFIADECRGTGDIFLYGEESYVTMNIQGDDIEEVEFRIFDASTNMIYDQVYSTFTNPGGDIGSPSDPLPIFAYVNQNPAIALPPEGFLFNEDSELVVDLAAYLSDPDDDMLLLTASGLSEVNVALDTYIVTFTAAVNWNGTEHVTFTVDDGNGGSASQTVPVTVIPVNDNPLLILPIADMTMDEDQAAVTIMLDEHFYDVDSDSLVFSAIYQNTALNLSINGNELSFAPKPNWNGITQVTIQASDGFMSVAEDFILTVNPINDLPQLVEVFSDYILAEDFNTFGITLSTHFTDIDGDELFYQIDFDPASINAILAGDIVYINSVENWNGSTAINIAAYDDISNEPATAIINITVNPVNDIPELELPESFEFAEDTIYEVDFAPYIFDVDMDALVLSVMPTVNIDVTIDSLLVTFSAPENYNGMEFITFQVNDNMGRLLATAQTQVIVTAENDQPYVVDDPLSSVEFAEDGQIQFLLTSIFNDPDLVYGDQLSYEVAGANEVIVTFSNNNVTLTAQENWFGQQLLTFTAFDQDNASIFHEVVVTVIPVNDPPYLVMPLPVLLLAEDFDVFTVNISDYFADVEDEMLNYSLEFDDTEFSAELTGTDLDIIQINSVENWFGTAALSVTAADMEMLSFSGEVILQIAPVNDAPVIDLPESISFAEDSNTFLDLSNYVIDVDANELIYTYTGNVSVNVNIEGAILQFSAVPDWYGSEVITITVDDGQGRLTDSDDIQVIVTPVNDPPVLQLPTSISFPEDGSTLLNVALYANDVDGDLLTLSLVNADNIQVSINLMTATISSLPDWNGSENITLAVSDGTAPQVTDIMTVIVTSVNDAPVLSLPASFTFLEDNSLAVNFTPYITDIDSDNFQLSISSGPEVIAVINGLSAVLSASLNWNGTEEIEVTVSDLEGGITSGNTDIIVLPVNDPPYILIPIPDPYVALEDFADVVLDLDDYFADFDGDELSYSAAFNPAHITIEITGSLATISSVPDWNGETTATLTISDGQARAQIIDSFTLQITPVNDAPQLNMPDEFSFNEDGSLAVNVSLYASDVEGDALTLTVTGNTQINVNPIGMTVILSAVPNWYGTETLTFTIDDEQGRLLASDDVTINVLSVNDTPVILSFEPVATELDTLQHSTVHFAVVVDDIDSTPSYEWRLNGVPTGDVDSELDYYFAEAGTFIVRVVITDGEYVLRVTWIVYAEETDNDGFEIIPEITAFCGNYPNPFNPRTTVKFSVDQLQNVKIDVYNAKGQLIRNLANQQFESGYHTIEWNGYDNRSSLQPSGVYFFRMQSLKSQDILKAVMLK
ncbi:MAG: tandem-95 repeat protein [Candidatus Cloacimonetes bacterium]|nr:tandem-95 repeat protein [Candidatus Cloacimonadota bacterium]